MEHDRLEYKNQINWKNLLKAIDFYHFEGFKYLEVPWFVPSEIIHITFPNNNHSHQFVGSGEQSFLHLQFNQGLDPGRYMTITPCFRNEIETEWNFKQFIKLELYITEDVDNNNLLTKIIPMCQDFFQKLLQKEIVKVTMPDQTYDLMCAGIELGSYGIRRYNGHSWIYATGLAEPRTSMVKRL